MRSRGVIIGRAGAIIIRKATRMSRVVGEEREVLK